MQGTFQFDVLLFGVGSTTTVNSGGGTTMTTIGLPTFTFNSGEGESVVTSPSGPFGSPYSVFATFTFQTAGIYQVSASGRVITTITDQFAEQVPIFQFNPTCNCTEQVGFQTVTRIQISHRQDIVNDVLQVSVVDPIEPEDPHSVPEPGTLALLGAALGAVSVFKRPRVS
jgi:hypothetical protein